MYLPDVTSFPTVPNPVTPGEFVVGGYWSPGDGGGGTFVWVPVLSGPLPNQDGGIVFHHPNDNTGYFKRLYSGPINVRWFGAIYDPTLRPDVTSYVHLARDYAEGGTYLGAGTVYFPKGRYPGAFIFTERTNILGDGADSLLQPASVDPVTGKAKPILTLGGGAYAGFSPTVSHIALNGDFNGVGKVCDGVYFDEAPPRTSQMSGFWEFDHVSFGGCEKGVHKPMGNIGNRFVKCLFYSNNYGYFATGYHNPPEPEMHAGCDTIEQGCMADNALAGIYIAGGDESYAQLIIDGLIIEGNPGFGIFVEFSGMAQMPTNGLSLRNIYMERNGGYLDNGTWVWSSVTLPNASYSVVTDYFFKGVRGVSITDSYIERIILESSSVELFGCRCDNYRSNAVVDVDADSSLVAHELKHATAVLESVFVQSLSYNNTKYVNIPTSVWGPLRIATQSGTYQIQASERFNQFMNYEFADSAGGGLNFY